MEGHPRRFMESYLAIRDRDGLLRPFRFNENQEYFYANTFANLKSYHQPMSVFELKDRKATWTTWVGGALFSYLFVPAFHAIHVTDSDDNTRAANQMYDLFYDNLPEWMKPKKRHWDTEFKELDWGPLTSSITMSSSRSRNFGRGSTPKAVFFDEMAHYSATFADDLFLAIGNSIPRSSAWVFKGSTPLKLAQEQGAGSERKQTRFYIDFRNIQDGKSSDIFLFRRWYDNPENVLPPGSPVSRPGDRRDITPGACDLYGSEREPSLVREFPQDGVPVADRLRWMRAVLADTVTGAASDGAAGLALFRQEHPEDPFSCWVDSTNPQFDTDRLLEMQRNSPQPILTHRVTGNFGTRIFEGYDAGHIYAAGMDPSGDGKDRTALVVVDCITRRTVAGIYGKADPGDIEDEVVWLLNRYPRCMLAVEKSGGYGREHIRTFRTLPEITLWGERQPFHRRSAAADREYRMRDLGWVTDKESRPRMIKNAILFINRWGGRLLVPELVQALLGYDPKVHEHLPDWVAAFCIAASIMQDALDWFAEGTGSALAPKRVQTVRVIAGSGPGSNWRLG